MIIDILITIPVLLLFSLLAFRCVGDWGAEPKLLGRFFPQVNQQSGCQGESPKEWKTFLFALLIRLAVLVAGLACVVISSESVLSLEECFQRLRLWDVPHYVNLIDQGYAGYQEGGQHIFLVFYPGYVWLVRLVKVIIPNTMLAGALVSTLCYAWGCCWVHKLAFERYGRAVARDAVLFLSLFPFSFFFGSVMTEGLFLLTTAAACYYALKHKWLAFGIWGCLAALTRMTGVLVIIPAGIELLKSVKPLARPLKISLKSSLKPILQAVPLIVLPLLGAAFYWLLNFYVDGDPFAFAIHQRHWYQEPMWFSNVLQYIFQNLWATPLDPISWSVWIPEALLFVLFFALLAVAARDRKNPSSLLLYAFFYLIANYSLSWLLSAGRYLSCGFVFFIFLAHAAKDKPNLRTGILVLEALFLGVYLFGYAQGAQIM